MARYVRSLIPRKAQLPKPSPTRNGIDLLKLEAIKLYSGTCDFVYSDSRLHQNNALRVCKSGFCGPNGVESSMQISAVCSYFIGSGAKYIAS